jgi:type II secretion system protein N
VYRHSGEKVSIGGLTVTPLGLQITDLSWQPPAPGWPAVKISSMRLSPLWTSLFSANQGLTFKASLPTGVMSGQVMKDGSLQASLSKVSLAPFFPADFSYRPHGLVAGRLTASGRFLGDDGSAEFDLNIDEAAVRGLEGLGVSSGQLSLGRLTVRGELQGATLKVDEVRIQEGDVQAQGRLTILLNDSPRLSRIAGQLDLAPASTLDPFLRDLLQLSGVQADRQGNFRFRISGSLESPVVR